MFFKEKKLITVLFLASLISLLCSRNVQAVLITYDDFSDLAASQSKWVVSDPDDISTYNATDGVVEIDYPPMSSWFYAESTYCFSGNFDIRMRYQDWSLTTSSNDPTNVQIGLQVHPVGGSADNFVYIFRGKDMYISNYSFGGEWGQGAGGDVGSDIAGWLRIARTGDSFDTYYSSDGTGWNLLYSATGGFTDPVLIQGSAYTGDTTVSFHAEFDKVDVESEGMAPVPEPATMILLGSLVTGLFGVAAVRKKR